MAISWIVPDEADDADDRLIDRVESQGAIAPALWRAETAHALVMMQRRRRLTEAAFHTAQTVLMALPVRIDDRANGAVWRQTTDLARTHGLTVYDACYLELAIRLSIPLATRDRALLSACAASGLVTAWSADGA